MLDSFSSLCAGFVSLLLSNVEGQNDYSVRLTVDGNFDLSVWFRFGDVGDVYTLWHDNGPLDGNQTLSIMKTNVVLSSDGFRYMYLGASGQGMTSTSDLVTAVQLDVGQTSSSHTNMTWDPSSPYTWTCDINSDGCCILVIDFLNDDNITVQNSNDCAADDPFQFLTSRSIQFEMSSTSSSPESMSTTDATIGTTSLEITGFKSHILIPTDTIALILYGVGAAALCLIFVACLLFCRKRRRKGKGSVDLMKSHSENSRRELDPNNNLHAPSTLEMESFDSNDPHNADGELQLEQTDEPPRNKQVGLASDANANGTNMDDLDDGNRVEMEDNQGEMGKQANSPRRKVSGEGGGMPGMRGMHETNESLHGELDAEVQQELDQNGVNANGAEVEPPQVSFGGPLMDPNMNIEDYINNMANGGMPDDMASIGSAENADEIARPDNEYDERNESDADEGHSSDEKEDILHDGHETTGAPKNDLD